MPEYWIGLPFALGCGLMLSTALPALADAHSPTTASPALDHAATLSSDDTPRAVLLAITINTASAASSPGSLAARSMPGASVGRCRCRSRPGRTPAR